MHGSLQPSGPSAELAAPVCCCAAADCCVPCTLNHALPAGRVARRVSHLSHSSRVLGGGLYGQAQVARDAAIQSDLRTIKQNLYCQVLHAPISCQLDCMVLPLLRVRAQC